MEEFDCLKLENQLCFPLYAASKEIVRKYKPLLDKLDLTYTQYITMMVLWEEKELNVKTLGERLFLDSGTLTPLLKKLEEKKYIERKKSMSDERNLIIKITPRGENLKQEAKQIPEQIGKCINLNEKEATTLYTILYKILEYEKNEN
ncbi:MAG: MarR family transcriptional regulator [Firmicutes bacterium]|nr:MarR family transcriptional regulator [Bacillota bacterium]